MSTGSDPRRALALHLLDVDLLAAVAKSGFGHEERVLGDLDHDVGVARHARAQLLRVGVGDVDLELEVGDVLDPLAERGDLAHHALEGALREGLGPDPRRLAQLDPRHLVLVDEAAQPQGVGGGEREQQRPARHGGDGRHRAAFFDVHVEHAPRERRGDGRVGELCREGLQRGGGAGHQRLRAFVAGLGRVALLGRSGAAALELVAAFDVDLREAQLHARLAQRRLGLAHLGGQQLPFDLDERLALLDDVPRFDVDPGDDAGDPRPDLDLADRLDGSGRDDDALDPPLLDLGRGPQVLRSAGPAARGLQREQQRGERSRGRCRANRRCGGWRACDDIGHSTGASRSEIGTLEI